MTLAVDKHIIDAIIGHDLKVSFKYKDIYKEAQIEDFTLEFRLKHITQSDYMRMTAYDDMSFGNLLLDDYEMIAFLKAFNNIDYIKENDEELDLEAMKPRERFLYLNTLSRYIQQVLIPDLKKK
mgnify:CR=1 FL=1